MLLTQGFIARHADGGTAILGRGGSDTSAAYFGALLGAQRVEIWTDVPGLFSANPRVVPDARLLTRLDYRSEEHTSELQSLMRISYAVFCLKKTNIITNS